mmetsp:Transcript_40506/g.42268  ORF Transcript_40506/g.42268 Transcript_40506/m.42268 type:complete len:268 (-) Transcript_40506:39-842(-)
MVENQTSIDELIKENISKIEQGKKTILLFDVDGTLTPSRKKVESKMTETLLNLSQKFTLGAVGGSDLNKIKEQLGSTLSFFEYVFSENGLVSHHKDKLIHTRKINEHLGEERQQKLVNFLLAHLADIEIPKKRGTFIEYRTGMFNVSPIGRNCSQEERDEFVIWNKDKHVVDQIRNATQEKFGEEYGLKCSIGGQISFDIVPIGWDKSYCLQFVEKEYDNIIFFGDKIYDGGNDYEIAIDKRVNCYFKTLTPDVTIEILEKLTPLIK